MRLSAWLAAALLAVSWLFGLEYYYPVCPWAWLASIAAAVVLLAGVRRGANDECGMTSDESGPATDDSSFASRRVAFAALALLVPAVWVAGWPYRMPPLLVAIGLAIWLLPKRQWTGRLALSLVAAGVVMLVQAVALELYVGWTMRWHDLPWPLPEGLAAVVGWLGAPATANGSAVVVHSLRQVHRLAASWELLIDPATWLFLVGGLAMLAQRGSGRHSCLPEEGPERADICPARQSPVRTATAPFKSRPAGGTYCAT